MTKISRKLILLLVLAALVPMSISGAVSIWTAREMAKKIVMEVNLEVAKRASHQIAQYLKNSEAILEALARTLSKNDLRPWQKERTIRAYVIQFETFRYLELTDRTGKRIATSRLEKRSDNLSGLAGVQSALSGKVYHSRVFMSKHFTPAMTIAIPVRSLGEISGVLIGELDLVEMWRLVDSIQIGEEGYALVISKEGHLVAHGLGSAKERVLQEEPLEGLPLLTGTGKKNPNAMIYASSQGIEVIGVMAAVPMLNWKLIIEQPTQEAYMASTRMSIQLAFLVMISLIVMILVGFIGGNRHIVLPIRELMRGVRSVGKGNLADKVKITTQDEFQELGTAFNLMTNDLIQLKEDVRLKERAALIGRIASGLVHDLRHPVKNLENSSRLMLRFYEEKKSRTLFEKTFEREIPNLNRLLDNLLDLSRPNQVKPILLNLSHLLRERLEDLSCNPRCVLLKAGQEERIAQEIPETNIQKKIVIYDIPLNPDLKIWADKFALERVLKNLITNAIEAMPEGGTLKVSGQEIISEDGKSRVTQIRISDTGSGISEAQLSHLFEDYNTTKNKGIGLGLAISKKMIEEHHAKIQVESTLEKGTSFTLQFPLPNETIKGSAN